MVLVTAASALMIAGSIGAASAFETGEWWTSEPDWTYTGISTVGTTNISGDSKTVHLWVLRATGGEMGYAQKAALPGDTVSHSCIGQPFLDRYGSIRVVGGRQRDPFFNVNG